MNLLQEIFMSSLNIFLLSCFSVFSCKIGLKWTIIKNNWILLNITIWVYYFPLHRNIEENYDL